jgi:hypothetical protein
LGGVASFIIYSNTAALVGRWVGETEADSMCCFFLVKDPFIRIKLKRLIMI